MVVFCNFGSTKLYLLSRLKKKITIKKDQITQTNPKTKKTKKKNKKQHFIFYFLNTPKPEILINISF